MWRHRPVALRQCCCASYAHEHCLVLLLARLSTHTHLLDHRQAAHCFPKCRENQSKICPYRYALVAAACLERLTSGAAAAAPPAAAAAAAAELAALRVPFRPGFTTPFPRVSLTLLPFARSAAILRNSAAAACLSAAARLLLNLTQCQEGCTVAAACGAVDAAATLLLRAGTCAGAEADALQAPTDAAARLDPGRRPLSCCFYCKWRCTTSVDSLCMLPSCRS